MIRNPIYSSRRDFLPISALPECINAAGAGEAASGFLMAMAMPAARH